MDLFKTDSWSKRFKLEVCVEVVETEVNDWNEGMAEQEAALW